MSLDSAKAIKWLRQNPAIVILIMTYTYLFCGILTRQNGWVEPEMLGMTGGFLEKKLPFMSLDWWTEGFDYPLWEYAPRIYRPLSSYFQMLDANFRQWLWQYMVPHPSLSLTWIFTLFLSPILLFLLLRRLKVSVNSALLVASLYIANTGVLSVATMYFRPAKPMTNFAILLCLWLAAVVSDKSEREKGSIASFRAFILFLFCMLFCFFWDETAIVIYPAVLFVFPKLVTRNRKFLSAFAAVPVVALFCYTQALPWITDVAGYPRPDLMTYGPTKNSFDFNTALHEHMHLPIDALLNLKIEFMDCFGLTYAYFLSSLGAQILQYATQLAVLSFLATCIYKLFKGHRELGIKSRVFALLLAFSLFNTYMVSSIGNNVWGLYYYGIYISVIFVLLVGLLFREFEGSWRFNKYWLVGLTGLIIASSFYIFPNTNYVYKHAHYYVADGHPAPLLKGTFLNNEDRFAMRDRYAIQGLYERSLEFWNCSQTSSQCAKPATPELTYLYVELFHF